MRHFRNTHEVKALLAVESVFGASIDISVEGFDGKGGAERKSFARGEACERRRQLNDEDALARSAPEVSASVVGDIGNIVGAEAVVIGDGVECLVVVVGDVDTSTLPHNSPQVIAKLYCLHVGVLDHFMMPCLHSTDIHDVEHSGFENFIGNFLFGGHLVAFHLIDDAVVG